MHSYDRRAIVAGLNGEVSITGNAEYGGTIYFKKYLQMPPSFDGAYLDKTIQNLGRRGLDRVLQAALKVVMAVSIQPPPVNRKPPSVKITEATGGMDGKGFYVAAEAQWTGSLAHSGWDLAHALEEVSRRESVSVTNAL